MSNILDEIKAYKVEEIAARKQSRPLGLLEQAAKHAGPTRGFHAALRRARESADLALICEIKRASPSKGLIRKDFDPPALATAYETGGATCLSVLTDTPSFQGSDDHLTTARDAVALPVLRKDFLYDPYQVVESRAIGADCILIIMASVTDAQARELESSAHEWTMDVLLEVHDEAELDRALRLTSPLIGINNRNLKTFEIDLATTERLAPLVPADRLIIGESGLSTARDLERLAKAGVTCFLIGESLMRQSDVAAATAALLA